MLSALGVRKNKRTTLRFDVATSLLAGMKKHGVRKLVWLDGAGVGSSKEFMQRSSFLFGRIVMPLFLNHMYADAAVADELIERSGCDWVIVRPMSFTNRAKTGNVSVVTDMSLTVRLRLRISRADVAAFLVEQVAEDNYVGQMPVICPRKALDRDSLIQNGLPFGRAPLQTDHHPLERSRLCTRL